MESKSNFVWSARSITPRYCVLIAKSFASLGEDEKVLKICGDPLRARSLHRLGQARLFQLCCNALSGAIGFFRHLQ